MSETSKELPEIRDALLSIPGVRVFRNNSGFFRIGGRPIRVGLGNGSADLIGWSRYIIRPEDVGKRIAVFTSIEAKTKDGDASEDQEKWRDDVISAGGVALITSSKVEAVDHVLGWVPGKR